MSYIYVYEGIGSSFNLNKYCCSKDISRELKYYSRQAEEIIGINIWEYMRNTPLERKDNSLYNWLSGYICNYVLSKTYMKSNLKPKLLAGYSLGLITGLAAHDAITFEEGISLVQLAFTYGNKDVKKKTSMAIILGLDRKYVQGIIQELDMQECVYIASENSDYNILLAGQTEQLDLVRAQCHVEGAIRIQSIDTPKAFHCKFAKQGIKEFIEGVEDIHIKPLKIPLISCYDYKLLREPEEIRKELVRNQYESMNWKNLLDKLVSEGNKQFLEISMNGKLMSMYIREQDRNIQYINIKQLMEG